MCAVMREMQMRMQTQSKENAISSEPIASPTCVSRTYYVARGVSVTQALDSDIDIPLSAYLSDNHSRTLSE